MPDTPPVTQSTQPKSPKPPMVVAPTPPPAQPATPVKDIYAVTGDRPKFNTNLQLTEKNLDDAVGYSEIDNPSTAIKHHGWCRKCGWQTMQTTKTDVVTAIKDHARRHVVAN